MLDTKNSESIDGLMQVVLENVRAQLASLSTGVHLALAELRVAVGHAGLIICLVIVAAGTILVGWGLLLVVGALLLTGFGMSAALAVLCMFLINTMALLGIGIAIRYTLSHMTFKHTRQALTPENSALGYAK